MKKIFYIIIGIALGGGLTAFAATNVSLTKDHVLQYINYIGDSLVIGNNATTTNSRLEVNGLITALNFTATSTSATSTLPNLSTTQIKVGTLSGIVKAVGGMLGVGATTDDLTEGSSNLYYTDDRGRQLMENFGFGTSTYADNAVVFYDPSIFNFNGDANFTWNKNTQILDVDNLIKAGSWSDKVTVGANGMVSWVNPILYLSPNNGGGGSIGFDVGTNILYMSPTSDSEIAAIYRTLSSDAKYIHFDYDGTGTSTIGINGATSSLPQLSVDTGLSLFGTYGKALSDFCIAITGGAGLCDGTDDTGSGSPYPFPLTGNATSSLTQFNGGLTAYGSSTIQILQSDRATTTNLGVLGQITQTGAATSSWTGGLSLGTGGLHITNGGLRVANLTNCNLDTDSNGVVTCGTDSVGSSFDYPFIDDATTTLLYLNGGVYADNVHITSNDISLPGSINFNGGQLVITNSSITGGYGQNLNLYGADDDGVNFASDVYIKAGNGGTTGADGSNVEIRGGDPYGTGNYGAVNLRGSTTLQDLFSDFKLSFNTSLLSANRIQKFPDKDGTFAMLSDITGGSFAYLFPSNATTTAIGFNGGLTFSQATGTSLYLSASSTIQILQSDKATTTNLGVTGQITQTGAATSSWTGGLSLGTGGLYITNGGLRVANLNAASCDLKADTNGVISCGTDATGSGSSYPFALSGNATSTLTQFNSGLTAYASSTIGGGGTYTGLTINGDATTTGALHLGTSVTGLWTLGVDSVTNAYKFSTNSNLYPSPLIISTSGNVGIGSTTPDVALDVTGAMEIVTNTDVVPFSITASTTEYVTKIENTVGDAQLRVVSSADYGAAVVLLEATADEYINIKGYIDGALKWIIGRSGEADGVSVFVSDGATEAIQFHDDRSTEFDGPMRFGLAGNCTKNLTSDAPAALDVDQCGTLSVTSDNTTSTNRTFCLLAGSEGQVLRIMADVSGANEIELGDGGAGACAGGTGAATFIAGVWPAATNQNNDIGTFIYRTTASGAQANGWYEVSRAAN